MLSEKKMLRRPSLRWFTGCRAGSPWHRPFCSRASISVPGAPAPSLATRSQELALNPGVEICAPDWVATALLATRQPWAPRSDTLLAPVGGPALPAGPVPAGELRLAPDPGPAPEPGLAREPTLTAEPRLTGGP